PSLVHERPQQISAMPIERCRIAESVQVTRDVANEKRAARQRSRPVVEVRLKRPAPLRSIDDPLPDLDFLVDRHDARHVQDESSDRERVLDGVTRRFAKRRWIFDDCDLAIRVVAKREVTMRLRPRKALAQPHRYPTAVDFSDETAVASAPEKRLGFSIV